MRWKFILTFLFFTILFFLPAYLIGSIPFGLILTKLFMKQDVRDIGSGNIGTTNVLRTGNKALALMTLFLDAGKGAYASQLHYKFELTVVSPGENCNFLTQKWRLFFLFAQSSVIVSQSG